MHNLREAICYVRNVQAANASKQKGQQKKSGESNVRLLQFISFQFIGKVKDFAVLRCSTDEFKKKIFKSEGFTYLLVITEMKKSVVWGCSVEAELIFV